MNAGNSCYLDSVLFAMFAMPSQLDALLTKPLPSVAAGINTRCLPSPQPLLPHHSSDELDSTLLHDPPTRGKARKLRFHDAFLPRAGCPTE